MPCHFRSGQGRGIYRVAPPVLDLGPSVCRGPAVRLGCLTSRTYGNPQLPSVWPGKFPDLRLHGFPDLRLHGFPELRLHGIPGLAWVPRSTVAWVTGCGDVQTVLATRVIVRSSSLQLVLCHQQSVSAGASASAAAITRLTDTFCVNGWAFLFERTGNDSILAQSSCPVLWGWNHGQHQGSSQSTAGGAIRAFKIQVGFSDALCLQECQLTRAITEKVCALQLPTEFFKSWRPCTASWAGQAPGHGLRIWLVPLIQDTCLGCFCIL